MKNKHHDVFYNFTPWKGVVRANFVPLFVGAMISLDFHNNWRNPDRSQDRQETTPYPQFDEEYFEWIDLLESVLAAKRQYIMIELGAGYGRWAVSAAKALEQKQRIPCKLIAVEAEPNHFQMLAKHLANNGLNPNEHLLINAAVTQFGQDTLFATGYADEWYGQSVVKSPDTRFTDFENMGVEKVAGVNLNTILEHLPFVDLLDMDIQGEELKVLSTCTRLLNRKVKRIHIGTHGSEIESGLRDLFNALGWLNVHDYSCFSKNRTPYGEIDFVDGVQTWANMEIENKFCEASFQEWDDEFKKLQCFFHKKMKTNTQNDEVSEVQEKQNLHRFSIGKEQNPTSRFPPIATDLRKLALQPHLHIHPSTACNLKCTYCTQKDVRTLNIVDDFLADFTIREFLSIIPPSHIYLSGGECLYHPSSREFVSQAGRLGHKVSFDTNLSIDRSTLDELIASWDPAWIGFFGVTHHRSSGLTLDEMIDRAIMIRSTGMAIQIGYIAIPDDLKTIQRNILALRELGISTGCTIFQGTWGTRSFPRDYTLQEMVMIMNMMPLGAAALQLFGGVRSHGLTCRGGNDSVTWNMKGDRALLRCCHGTPCPVKLEDTFFVTGIKKRQPCPFDTCVGSIYFTYGINGLTQDVDNFAAHLEGDFDFIGTTGAIDYIDNIRDRGVSLVNELKYAAFKKSVVDDLTTIDYYYEEALAAGDEIDGLFSLKNIQQYNIEWLQEGEKITLVTVPRLWHYAVGFPMIRNDAILSSFGSQSVHLQVKVNVERGCVAIGVVKRDNETYMDEYQSVSESTSRYYYLTIQPLEDVGSLIVRNAAEGVSSKVTIEDIKVFRTQLGSINN